MDALPAHTRIDLAAEDVRSSRCLYVPPNALPDVELPDRILLEGPTASRVVGWTSTPAAADETVLLASASLCHAVAGTTFQQVYFEAHISKARLRDLLHDLDRTTVLKLVGGFGAGVVAIATGLYGILESKLSFGIIAVVLALVVIGAALSAYSAVHEATTINCE